YLAAGEECERAGRLLGATSWQLWRRAMAPDARSSASGTPGGVQTERLRMLADEEGNRTGDGEPCLAPRIATALPLLLADIRVDPGGQRHEACVQGWPRCGHGGLVSAQHDRARMGQAVSPAVGSSLSKPRSPITARASRANTVAARLGARASSAQACCPHSQAFMVGSRFAPLATRSSSRRALVDSARARAAQA